MTELTLRGPSLKAIAVKKAELSEVMSRSIPALDLLRPIEEAIWGEERIKRS